MIQDSRSRNLHETALVADQLKQSGVKLIAVGSQSSVPVSDLRAVASSSYDVLSVATYTRLLGRVDRLARIMCLPFGNHCRVMLLVLSGRTANFPCSALNLQLTDDRLCAANGNPLEVIKFWR